jgi:hypothetical protein
VCENTLLPCAGAGGHSPRRQLVLLRPRQQQRRLRGDGAHGGGAAPAVGVGDGADGPRFAWHLSNVQTWASAALTDADTCLDSLRSGRDEDAVRRRVLAVAQATSNALVNKLDPAPPPPPPRLVTAVNNDGVTNNKAHRVQTTLHSTPLHQLIRHYCTVRMLVFLSVMHALLLYSSFSPSQLSGRVAALATHRLLFVCIEVLKVCVDQLLARVKKTIKTKTEVKMFLLQYIGLVFMKTWSLGETRPGPDFIENQLVRLGTYYVHIDLSCTYRVYKLTKFIKI